MSFILDALKKSETERQQQGSAEFVNVPTGGSRREGPPAWLWVLGALLLVNLVVLAGIMIRSEGRQAATGIQPAGSLATAPVESGSAQTGAAAPPPAQAGNDFTDRLAAAREAGLPRQDSAAVTGAPANDSQAAVAPDRAPVSGPAGNVTSVSRRTNTAALPTIHEVRANGLVNVGELHVDIHVFAENPTGRFVFINMAKYTEGARLAEGPLVEEITVDGVVLSHDGTTFLLPRD